jgi:glycosyltransferase involved in cell wall biosynthesis
MLSHEEHPRVLVVGHTPFSRVTGTAMTLSNLFAGWPKDRLAQVYTAGMTPSTEVCEDYFAFPARDHYPAAQYRAMRMLGWDGRSPLKESRPVAAMQAAADRDPTVAKIYSHVRAIADLSPVHITEELTNFMRQFRPDLIYSMLGSVRLTKITAVAARICGVPVMPHFTDDWPTTLYSSELFGRADRAVRKEVERIIRLAPLGMVISRPMAEEYHRRHGIEFAPFVNCVDETYFGSPRDEVATPGRTTELVYVGALHLNRWQSLVDIGAALEEVAPAGSPARLTIHAPQRDLDEHREHFGHLPRVRLGPALESHEVPAALRSASVLVHIESFDEDVRRYTRFSVSTKIPQYLAAARPILGYGPAEVASINHIREADAGVIVGIKDHPALVRGLTELCRNAALRGRLARNGVAFARQEHAGDHVAARFAATLRSAVHAGSAVAQSTHEG